ncbi:MAG: hypothetical protein AAGK97_05975 [Bacteroidota bacterium]
MNLSRILIATLIAALFTFATDYLFYGILMSDQYTGSVFLETPRFVWMIVGYFIFGYAFAHIYVRGLEEKPVVPQGVRYGVLVALLVFVFGNLMSYSTMNIANMNQILTDSAYRIVQMVILGVTVASFIGGNAGRPGMSSGGGA